MALLVLFGGPAGAGKSTLARAWCATRSRSVQIELDAVRELIVAGRADPQQPGPLQSDQYVLSASACLALARVFLEAGYDVALDDALPPNAFEAHWRPRLRGIEWRLVIVLPTLAETLARSAGRTKRVRETHTRNQHAASYGWSESCRIDTTGLTVEESLELVIRLVGDQ
jgi:predicted kinase